LSRAEGCERRPLRLQKFPGPAADLIVGDVALPQMPWNQAGFRHEFVARQPGPPCERAALSHLVGCENLGKDLSRICVRCGRAPQYLARYVLKEGRPIVAG